jgi:phosphoglycerate dehydrogenase-like enzyme
MNQWINKYDSMETAMARPTVALIFAPEIQRQVISPATREAMAQAFNLVGPTAEGKVTPEQAMELLKDADGCMTGWGSPTLSAEVLAKAPKLKIAAHSAGTVKFFVSDAFFERGIAVTSASAVLAVHVADFTMGLILVGIKNVFELSESVLERDRLGTTSWWDKSAGHRPPEDPRGCTVGVIAASHVGRNLLKLLPAFEIKALLYDPYVSAEQARALNAEKVELDELFSRSDAVCCHAPSIPATKHMVNAERLAKMKHGAIFINNSRGSCVDESALVNELKQKRIWAYLDVFEPEPPPPGSPLYSCPNLTMTPHIAGCQGRGRQKLGEQAFKELTSFFAGQPLQYPLTSKMLEVMG